MSWGMNIFRPAFLAILTLALPMSVFAADTSTEAPTPEEEVIVEGTTVNLEDFLWLKRPVIVFADSPADPAYVQQMQYLTSGMDELIERDIIVLTDTDPAAQSDLRTKLRPRGFMLTLIGKDGEIKLRKPLPWSVRELTRTIDKMPMRQQEIRDRRESNF
jgi:hypothetical protein